MLARLSLALAGSTLLLASPAFAQAEPVSIKVDFADLNLATDAGRARLDRRIRIAASRVCDTGSRGVAAWASEDLCRNEALASAKREVARLAPLNGDNVRLARNAR